MAIPQPIIDAMLAAIPEATDDELRTEWKHQRKMDRRVHDCYIHEMVRRGLLDRETADENANTRGEARGRGWL